MSRSSGISSVLPAFVSLLAAGSVALAYWQGVGTDAGRDVDAYLLRHGDDAVVELIGDTLVFLVNPLTAAIATLLVLRHALQAGRRADGVRAVLIVAGATVASTLLKRLLEDHDPLGDEGARALGTGFFPSGHATVVMALCLAALLVLAPRRRAPTLALGTIASVLAFSVAAGRSHHLSDVYGGFLLAAAVAALCLVGRASRGGLEPPGGRPAARDVVRRIGLVVGVILALESPRYVFRPQHLPGEAATAIAVCAIAFALVVSFAWLLGVSERA